MDGKISTPIPSVRIMQIYDQWHPQNPMGDTELAKTADMLSAIMAYLDECAKEK